MVEKPAARREYPPGGNLPLTFLANTTTPALSNFIAFRKISGHIPEGKRSNMVMKRIYHGPWTLAGLAFAILAAVALLSRFPVEKTAMRTTANIIWTTRI